MIARYKGKPETIGCIIFEPGSKHVIKTRRRIITKSNWIWISIDGMLEIPYTLEGLFKVWEPVEKEETQWDA